MSSKIPHSQLKIENDCEVRKKMSKQDVIDYVFETPHNTNPAILNQKLDELIKENEGGGATEPYIEETYDDNGNLIEANLVGYTKVRNYAFYNCSNLALTSLPDGITNIGSYAFMNCTNLALTSLPDGITSIGYQAFYDCKNLALTSLPSGITSIEGRAFTNCRNLALTSLPSGITSIKNSTFSNCKNLALTSLPSGITSIESKAFNNCTGLTSITFEGTPNSIGIDNDVFAGCTNLTTINVPWKENEVANAPWGATNATINYNYTGASEEEILSPTTFTFGDNSQIVFDYLMSENSASASLVEGKTYVVTMDGNDYNCTAYANSNINGFICLDIDSTFSYANGYMLSNDLSYVGSKTISIKLVS